VAGRKGPGLDRPRLACPHVRLRELIRGARRA
jgi:hypothetical protein